MFTPYLEEEQKLIYIILTMRNGCQVKDRVLLHILGFRPHAIDNPAAFEVLCISLLSVEHVRYWPSRTVSSSSANLLSKLLFVILKMEDRISELRKKHIR